MVPSAIATERAIFALANISNLLLFCLSIDLPCAGKIGENRNYSKVSKPTGQSGGRLHERPEKQPSRSDIRRHSAHHRARVAGRFRPNDRVSAGRTMLSCAMTSSIAPRPSADDRDVSACATDDAAGEPVAGASAERHTYSHTRTARSVCCQDCYIGVTCSKPR